MSERPGTSVDEGPVLPPPREHLTGRALGIDVGGTGIKAAVVDVASGRLVTERIREPTPRPATLEAVMDVVVDIVRRLEATGELTTGMAGGAGFPSVIKAGKVMTATNLDRSWIGAPVQQMFGLQLGRPMEVLNDADAAGIAETAYGAGKGQPGVVLLLALGTGIGSSLLVDGELVPNLQLGHVKLRGRDAETRVSAAARVRRRIGWRKWAGEFNELLAQYEEYVWPDLIILGGGMAKEFSRYRKFLRTRAPLVAAGMGNTAGIIGAARVGDHRVLAARATPESRS